MKICLDTGIVNRKERFSRNQSFVILYVLEVINVTGFLMQSIKRECLNVSYMTLNKTLSENFTNAYFEDTLNVEIVICLQFFYCIGEKERQVRCFVVTYVTEASLYQHSFCISEDTIKRAVDAVKRIFRTSLLAFFSLILCHLGCIMLLRSSNDFPAT